MEPNYRFPRGELLRYRHVPAYTSGEDYVIVMANLFPAGSVKPGDYALRAKASRDGLEAFRFTEKNLRKKATDRDLYWTVTDEGDGTVSLYSPAARRYLAMDGEKAFLSRKKQVLTLTKNGSMLRFSIKDKDGKTQFLHASVRDEAASKFVFAPANRSGETTFALLKRAHGLSPKPAGKPILTVGTYADVHVDYGLQLKPPYLRKSIIKAARGLKNRYDLDALLLCGDNFSDNGSHKMQIGAVQGNWSYARWKITRSRLDAALKKAFRNPKKAGNILYLTGNHEYQAGDRQPEGQLYNSAYYTDLLPKGITHPLTEPFAADLGSKENMLCYQYRVGDVFFLVFNQPAFPFMVDWPFPERGNPAHDLRQARWLEERLNDIEKEKGTSAVIFVTSHFPFTRGAFSDTYGVCPPNTEAFMRMDRAMMRFPNLFWLFGHVHGGDRWMTFTDTAENMQWSSPVEMKLIPADGFMDLDTQEASEREKFCSDVILGTGFHHIYAGSHAFYHNSFFANDGKKIPSTLTNVEIPFFQNLIAEVYDDRVVLTMQNFGTKKGTLSCLTGATYRLKPLVCPLVK